MTLYIILLFLSILFAIIAHYSKTKNYILGGTLMGFLCLMCALRDLECGTDTLNYLIIFTEDPNNPLREPLYVLSMLLIRDYRVFLFFYAIITYSLIFFSLTKEVRLICFGIVVFLICPNKLFPETFNIIRQALAGSLILFAFIEVKHGYKWKSIICIFIACGFHFSSIIAFPFLLVRQQCYNLRFSITIVFTTFIFGILGGAQIIVEMLIQLLGIGWGDYITLLALKTLSYSEKLQGASFTYNLTLLVPNILCCLITYPYKELSKNKYGYYYNIFILTTVLGNIFIPAMPYGFRFIYSLEFIQLLIVPMAYQYESNRTRLYIIALMILNIGIYIHYLYHLPSVGNRGIVPYKSII